MEHGSKLCSQCGEEKSRGDFYVRNASPDGLHPHCIVCEKQLKLLRQGKTRLATRNRRRQRVWVRQPGQDLKCPECDRYFSRQPNLVAHRRSLHGYVIPKPSPETGFTFGCDDCGRWFKERRGLLNHQAHAHDAALARYDREAKRRYSLVKYGLSPEDYETLLAAQSGMCATCSATPDAQPFGCLSVDHDHATGAVRGLLCMNCNHALGKAKDDPTVLRRLAAYLEGGGTYGR